MTLQTGANSGAGNSLSGTIGATTGVLVAKNTFQGSVTIQNTHASNNLFLSFASGGATASDFKLGPGASITFPYGLANDLSGVGSAAGTTWAAIGV